MKNSCALVTIYKKKEYKIYNAGDMYIVHNSNLEFAGHHTHLKNFYTCKFLIDLCIHKTVPKHLSIYLLESILRISNDSSYKYKIESMLINEKNKKKNGGNYNA